MKNYLWSPKYVSFFPSSLIEDYNKNSWDLSDAIEIDDDVYVEYSSTPPPNKMLACVNGLPGWDDLPPETHEQLVIIAESEKAKLRSEADYQITWLEDAVSSGVATNSEVEALAKWKSYRINIMRVNTNSAPGITWPEI